MMIGGVESMKKSRQATRHSVAVVDEDVCDDKIRAEGRSGVWLNEQQKKKQSWFICGLVCKIIET